jgi:hypothetical protein
MCSRPVLGGVIPPSQKHSWTPTVTVLVVDDAVLLSRRAVNRGTCAIRHMLYWRGPTTVGRLATTRAKSSRRVATFPLKPSAAVDTRVIYCGEQPRSLATG